MDEDPTSGNYDAHLAGLPGDGEEDLVAVDAAALGFGASSSDAPIELDGADGKGVAAGSLPSPTGSTASSGSCGGVKSCRSSIWRSFDPLYREENGKTKRYGAFCHVCKKTLSA
ncbi:hypothetical protein ACP70R_048525 [Stipagrostis hirtigluma subsp. patula]